LRGMAKKDLMGCRFPKASFVVVMRGRGGLLKQGDGRCV
jgi:hypothetical protein